MSLHDKWKHIFEHAKHETVKKFAEMKMAQTDSQSVSA